jgi:hypothetical protein
VIINVTWSEKTVYRADIEAPDGYDPNLPHNEQPGGVIDALWPSLHQAGVKTSLDIDDNVIVIEEAAR